MPQKDNAYFTNTKELELKDHETYILKEKRIEVKYTESVEETIVKKTMEIKRMAYYSKKNNATFVYWTNNLKISASDIINIY